MTKDQIDRVRGLWLTNNRVEGTKIKSTPQRNALNAWERDYAPKARWNKEKDEWRLNERLNNNSNAKCQAPSALLPRLCLSFNVISTSNRIHHICICIMSARIMQESSSSLSEYFTTYCTYNDHFVFPWAWQGLRMSTEDVQHNRKRILSSFLLFFIESLHFWYSIFFCNL